MAEGIRGSWNKNWLMVCSSVTCNPRNVAVTSLHTGQVIQTMLFLKNLCKRFTDAMVIAGEVVDGYAVRNKAPINFPYLSKSVGKGPTDSEQSFIVWNYKGNGNAQDRGNY